MNTSFGIEKELKGHARIPIININTFDCSHKYIFMGYRAYLIVSNPLSLYVVYGRDYEVMNGHYSKTICMFNIYELSFFVVLILFDFYVQFFMKFILKNVSDYMLLYTLQCVFKLWKWCIVSSFKKWWLYLAGFFLFSFIFYFLLSSSLSS